MTNYNMQAEQDIIGSILRNNDLFYSISTKMNQDVFYYPVHALIYATFCDLIPDGKSCNALVINAKLENNSDYAEAGGASYLARLIAHAGLVTPDHIEMLNELAALRIAINACNSFLALSDTVGYGDSQALIETLKNDISAPANTLLKLKVRSEKQALEDIAADMQSGIKPVPTGLPRLDKALDGGFYAGRSYCVAARKKMGKTALAATIAKNIANSGHNILYICAEMGYKQIQRRISSRFLGIPINRFDHDTKSIANAMNVASQHLFYADAPGISFNDLKTLIPASVKRYKLSGFVLDYWQLVRGKDGRTNQADHLESVAQWIADYCVANNIWALVIAQQNQDGNTRGSEGIKLAFDLVVSLCGDTETPMRYLEMSDSRHTRLMDIGSENDPAYQLNERGVFMEELTASDSYYSQGRFDNGIQ